MPTSTLHPPYWQLALKLVVKTPVSIDTGMHQCVRFDFLMKQATEYFLSMRQFYDCMDVLRHETCCLLKIYIQI